MAQGADKYVNRGVVYDGTGLLETFMSGKNVRAIDLTYTLQQASGNRARLYPSTAERAFPNTFLRQTPRA
jgi:hypothetical protein